MRPLVFATRNRGKLVELRQLLPGVEVHQLRAEPEQLPQLAQLVGRAGGDEDARTVGRTHGGAAHPTRR